MKKMDRYPIDYFITIEYINEVLRESNSLSYSILNWVDFSKGSFFAYLPDDLDKKHLLEFRRGGVSSNSYEEIAHFILDIMNKNSRLSLIIDDVIRDSEDKNIRNFNVPVLLMEREVYYFISNPSANQKKICRCLQESNAIWHTVSILVEDVFFETDFIDLKILKEVAEKTSLLIVGAYDGEGYVFWEKS